MKNLNGTSAAALLVAGAFAASSPPAARADDLAPPAVPAGLEVPAGNQPFLVGHAAGTQDYVCLPSGAAFAWALFTPEATLFGGEDRQLTTHFFSPNPAEQGAVRPTWLHSRDSSAVWARLFHDPATDPAFVAPGAIPWLLLQQAGVREGPGGGRTLAVTTFVQRVNTAGGVAPKTGCASAADVGAKAFVPYTADYVFYRSAGGG